MIRYSILAIILVVTQTAQADSANPYSPNSQQNPYGAGSPYSDQNNPYSDFNSPYGQTNPNNPYGQGLPVSPNLEMDSD